MTGLVPARPEKGTPVRTVWDAFSEHVRHAPRAPAMRGEREYTYSGLHAIASEVSMAIAAAAPPGSVVAVDTATVSGATIAILAAWRSRCVVLPISRQTPPLHRANVMEDARPVAILAEREDGTLSVRECDQVLASNGDGDPAGNGVTDIAYIIYTSGSTGRPKGVMVPQQSLLDRLQALASVPGFGADDAMLAMAPHTFDLSMIEMLLPLVAGGALVAAPPAARLDPAVFTAVVNAEEPDVVEATPSFWRLALTNGWRGVPRSRIWCGGEALTPALAGKLLPVCAQLWNVYGPTEGTLWATAARVTSPDVIDLGRPLPGVGLYLEADDGTAITQAHRQGEIILTGDSLATGYFRRPELTSQRFGVRSVAGTRRRYYRTGDLAQYREDGTLDFLGRADGQVKLRGYRIELGGLEAIAEEHPAVAEAAAVLRDGDDPRRAHIAMFVVPDGELTSRDVRQWIAGRVPAGMRPGRIFIQPALPRTTSGKVDRQALQTAGAR